MTDWTGPEAIRHALSKLDLDEMEQQHRKAITDRKVTARPRAVRVLNIIQGLRKNKLDPADMMISQVPVIPPRFRPFSVTGNTFLPGDANELYRDLVEYRRLYVRTEKELGREGAGDVYRDMNAAVKAAYGYGESPNPKTRGRAVKGFFEQVVGTNPKTSFVQSRMLSKPMDTVGRGVVIPDADYGMDEVGMPEDMAWKLYGQYVQRRLVKGGMDPASALRHVKDRTPQARVALDAETHPVTGRPAVLTRSPAWHKMNAIGQHVRVVPGDAIRTNNYCSEGLNMDYDGDTVSLHIPSSPEAVKDVRERMMASKMLWSIKDRGKTMANPKHEQILGLTMAGEPGGRKHKFGSEAEASAALDRGDVDLNDEIEIG